MNRGIEPASVDPDRLSDALSELVLTGRKFVLARSWCASYPAFVCWVEQRNNCQYGMPFVASTVEDAVWDAVRWVRGESSWI